jgi:Protein of unknown function (DUF3304)
MHMQRDAFRAITWVTCAMVAVLLLTACQREKGLITPAELAASMAAAGISTEVPVSGPKRSSQLRYSLGIVGYNYTETGIIDYSVNGTGAFNLGVSTEHSGGGSTVCCFGWAPGMKLPMPIRIEWTRDEATWCRKTVMLADPGPLEPTTFEVHFYPDRHIEVAITDDYSPPQLKLASTGGDYRIGKDVRKEKADAMQKDSEVAECREGRFPIGVLAEQEDREKRAKK